MARGNTWGWAWVALTAALGIHVVDEAATDFLGLWNPLVLEIRRSVPWSPLPTFTFETWATGLALLIALLAALSPLALRGTRWMRPLAYVFGVVMLFNGLGHIAASVYLGLLAPGVFSAPLLLAASSWLLVALARSTAARNTADAR
jgi:hypothetical protein